MANTVTQTSPANGATIIGLTPTFQWNYAVEDTGFNQRGHDIQVSRVSDGVLVWDARYDAHGNAGGGGINQSGSHSTPYGTIASGGFGGTQFVGPNPLVSGTQYRWRVGISRNTGSGFVTPIWGAFRTFTPYTNTAPTATQTAPANGAQVSTLTPTLAVSFFDADVPAELSGFAAYQIQVERVSDGQSFWDSGQLATTGTQQTNRAADVVYAGTALTNSVQYRWRVRVFDSGGLQSAYTAFRTFTPAAVPSPPTINLSGLTNTLTPTIDGTYNQGIGDTEASYRYQIRQGETTTIYDSGDVTGVIGTGQAYGTNNPNDTPSSPPALQWGTQYYVRALSTDDSAGVSDFSEWQAFHTNSAPNQPTNLSPPEGSVTDDTTPALSWQHNDPDGDAQTQADIELIEVGVGFVSGYDPKTLTQSGQSHVVTETLTKNPTAYQYRIRTKGLAGPGFGPYSEFVNFTESDVYGVTITDPTELEVIGAPSFTVTWSKSGGSGTQATYRVLVLSQDEMTVVYDSGVVSSASLSAVIPPGLLADDTTYKVKVESEDTLAQGAESQIVQFVTSFTLPATIEGLTATAIGGQN